jgi:hypothetical protein
MSIDVASLRRLFSEESAHAWVQTARVTKVTVDDDSEAVWVDVFVEATELEVRCALWMPYGGAGFGLYILPEVDSETLCVFPSPNVAALGAGVQPDLLGGVCLGVIPNDLNQIGTGADAPVVGTLLLALKATHKLVVKKAGGHTLLKVDATADKVQIAVDGGNVEIAAGGGTVNIGGGTGKVTIATAGQVDITAAAQVTLPDGTLPIARVGDTIVGTAGPFPVAAVIGPPGNPKVLG